MTVVWMRHEELWEWWEIVYEEPDRRFYDKADVPDELLAEFLAAKEQMEAVWGKLNDLMREEDL